MAHVAELTGCAAASCPADEPTFFAGETFCGEPAVFQRTTTEPVYRDLRTARDLLDIYRKDAADQGDWFRQHAARYAAQLEQAINQVERAHVHA